MSEWYDKDDALTTARKRAKWDDDAAAIAWAQDHITAKNDNAKGWCDCAWDFTDGARCTTCGHRIPDTEFANSNPFDVLSEQGRDCNARKARKALRLVK